MSADGASSVEGATVIKHGPPVHAKIPIHDEFQGNIEVEFVLSEADAIKVTKLNSSVARLYFGHELGPALQEALRMGLEL